MGTLKSILHLPQLLKVSSNYFWVTFLDTFPTNRLIYQYQYKCCAFLLAVCSNLCDLPQAEMSENQHIELYHALILKKKAKRKAIVPEQSTIPSNQANDYSLEDKALIAASLPRNPYLNDRLRYVKKEERRIQEELNQQYRQTHELSYEENQMAAYSREAVPLRKGAKKYNRADLSKLTLKLLSQKFDENFSVERGLALKYRMSLKQIGSMFGMSAGTIHLLYRQWLDDPSLMIRLNKHGYMDEPDGKCTIERLQQMKRILKDNPFLTLMQIAMELNKIQDLKRIKHGERQEITLPMVAQLLKLGKFRKKRVKCIPKEKNTTKTIEIRFEYCQQYRELLQRRTKIFFLDETGFNLYSTRDKAWSRPNEEITVNCPINKGKRYSLIAIISDEGLAHWRIIQGTYRKYQYLDFIRQLFDRVKSLSDGIQKCLILDNCAIHDKEQSRALAAECGMKLLYLPPYSPQLNPIQNWFHEVKTKVRKSNYSGERELMQIMQRILTGYESQDLSNYYAGVLKYVQRGLEKDKF